MFGDNILQRPVMYVQEWLRLGFTCVNWKYKQELANFSSENWKALQNGSTNGNEQNLPLISEKHFFVTR